MVNACEESVISAHQAATDGMEAAHACSVCSLATLLLIRQCPSLHCCAFRSAH